MLLDHTQHWLMSSGTFPQAKDNEQPQAQRFTVSGLPPKVIYHDSNTSMQKTAQEYCLEVINFHCLPERKTVQVMATLLSTRQLSFTVISSRCVNSFQFFVKVHRNPV